MYREAHLSKALRMVKNDTTSLLNIMSLPSAMSDQNWYSKILNPELSKAETVKIKNALAAAEVIIGRFDFVRLQCKAISCQERLVIKFKKNWAPEKGLEEGLPIKIVCDFDLSEDMALSICNSILDDFMQNDYDLKHSLEKWVHFRVLYNFVYTNSNN